MKKDYVEQLIDDNVDYTPNISIFKDKLSLNSKKVKNRKFKYAITFASLIIVVCLGFGINFLINNSNGESNVSNIYNEFTLPNEQGKLYYADSYSNDEYDVLSVIIRNGSCDTIFITSCEDYTIKSVKLNDNIAAIFENGYYKVNIDSYEIDPVIDIYFEKGTFNKHKYYVKKDKWGMIDATTDTGFSGDHVSTRFYLYANDITEENKVFIHIGIPMTYVGNEPKVENIGTTKDLNEAISNIDLNKILILDEKTINTLTIENITYNYSNIRNETKVYVQYGLNTVIGVFTNKGENYFLNETKEGYYELELDEKVLYLFMKKIRTNNGLSFYLYECFKNDGNQKDYVAYCQTSDYIQYKVEFRLTGENMSLDVEEIIENVELYSVE